MWDEKTFMQIKAEANDLHENLPLAFENIKKFPQMWSKSLVIDPSKFIVCCKCRCFGV